MRIDSRTVSVGATIALGALLGLGLGVVVGLTTDIPLARGALGGRLSRRGGT
jgi:hypothetical protein